MEVIHNVIRTIGVKKLNAASDAVGEFRTKLKKLVLNGCRASCFVGGLTLISACSQLPSDTRLSEHQSVLLDNDRQENSGQVATTADRLVVRIFKLFSTALLITGMPILIIIHSYLVMC